MRIMEVILVLVTVAAVTAADGGMIVPDSADTYPQDPRIYHDYWSDRTSHPGDAYAFEAFFQVPRTGLYEWRVPANHSLGVHNAFQDLYASFQVHEAGRFLGDFVDGVTRSFHAGAGELVETRFSYVIRDLEPNQYQVLLENNQMLREAEAEAWPEAGIVVRDQEVTVIIQLQQVASEVDPECGEGSCVGVEPLVGREFALIHNLASMRLEAHTIQAPPIQITTTTAATTVTVEGSRYTANDRIHVQASTTGLPSDARLLLTIDGKDVPIALDATPRLLDLPAGEHRLVYRVELPPGSTPLQVEVDLQATHTAFDIHDHFTVERDPPDRGPPAWMWLAVAAGGLLVFAAKVARRRKPALRL